MCSLQSVVCPVSVKLKVHSAVFRFPSVEALHCALCKGCELSTVHCVKAVHCVKTVNCVEAVHCALCKGCALYGDCALCKGCTLCRGCALCTV